MDDNITSFSQAGDPLRQRWRQTGLVLCFLIPILVYAYNAHFTRFFQDDFEYALALAQKGFWGSFEYYYNTWTGNYSATFVQQLFALPSPQFPGVMLALLLLAWWGGSVWLMYEIVLLLQLPRPRFLAIFGGSMVLATTIDGLLLPYQSLYWLAGAASHVIPIVFLLFSLAALGFVARRTPPGRIPIGLTLVTPVFIFIAAGFSTPSSAHMLTLFGLILIGSWRYATADRRRTVWPMLVLAMVVVVVAMIVIAIAPGTAVRQTKFPEPASLPTIARVTLFYSIHAIIAIIGRSPFTVLVTLVLSGTIGFLYHPTSGARTQQHKWRYLGGVIGVGFVLIMACFSTGVYAMSNYLPPRALTTPVLTFVMMVAGVGYIIGVDVRRTYQHSLAERAIVLAIVAVLLVLGPIRLAVQELAFSSDMVTFAQEWDAMDKQLTEAAANGEREVVVAKFTMDLGDLALNAPLGEHPDWYANRTYARYYGVDTVIAR